MENENIVSSGDYLPENYVVEIPPDTPVTLYADNVVMMSAAEPIADGTGSGYQLSEYFVNYFQGYLANMSETEYLAFAERVYNGNNTYSYIDHYYLVYDLNVQNGGVVNGNYPCVHITRDSTNNSYYNVTETTYSLTSYPSFSYGSVQGTSDLRKGGTHYETYALFFCFAFLMLYIVFRDIFKHIPMFERKSK